MQIDGPANIPNSDVSPNAQGIDIEALHAEVAKWQERVPKLAAALRERTEELASVRQDLREAQKAGAEHPPHDAEADDARLQTRDQLITELQQKVTDLAVLHRTAASELHATQMDLSNATEEAKGWQDKWQQVTSSLDSSVADATRSSSDWQKTKQQWAEQEQSLIASHSKEMERAKRDTESLQVRNANLQETMEFANKQLESLGEDMARLVEQDKKADASLAAAQHEIEQLSALDSDLQQRVVGAERDVASSQSKLNECLEELQKAQADNAAQADKIIEIEQQTNKADEQLANQADKFERSLEDEDQRYAAAMQAADEEQMQLAKQLDDKDKAAEKIKQQLSAEQQTNAKLAQEVQTLSTAAVSAGQELDESAILTQAKAGQIKVLESEQTKLNQALAETQQSLVETQEKLREELDAASAAASIANDQAAEVKKLQQEQKRWQDTEKDLLAQVSQVAAAGTEKEADLESEIGRLNECVGQAQDSNSHRENERRELAAKIDLLEAQNVKIKASLEERAELVRSLETEREKTAASHDQANAGQAQLQTQLAEAKNRVETLKEHADTLDSKHVTQQELMSDLEAELSESHEQSSAELKAAVHARRSAEDETRALTEQSDKLQQQFEELQTINGELLEQASEQTSDMEVLADQVEREQSARTDQQNAVHTLQAELHDGAEAHAQEIAVLQAQIHEYETKAGSTAAENPVQAKGQLQELEQLLRERTEELDNLRWRQEQQPATADDNLVMVLNQQLADSRAENKRLSDKLAKTSSVVVSSAPNKDEGADDLTLLKGIGTKLAEQLAQLGITRFQQIADLDSKELAQKEHALHAFRTRLMRDGWIKQAKKAISG